MEILTISLSGLLGVFASILTTKFTYEIETKKHFREEREKLYLQFSSFLHQVINNYQLAVEPEFRQKLKNHQIALNLFASNKTFSKISEFDILLDKIQENSHAVLSELNEDLIKEGLATNETFPDGEKYVLYDMEVMDIDKVEKNKFIDNCKNDINKCIDELYCEMRKDLRSYLR